MGPSAVFTVIVRPLMLSSQSTQAVGVADGIDTDGRRRSLQRLGLPRSAQCDVDLIGAPLGVAADLLAVAVQHGALAGELFGRDEGHVPTVGPTGDCAQRLPFPAAADP